MIKGRTNYTYLLKEYQKLQNKEEQLQIINSFAIELIKKVNIEEIVWYIAKNVAARMGFFDCVVYLYNESEKCLIQKAAHGPKNPILFDIKDPLVIKLGSGIVGSAAKSGKSQLVSDTRLDSRYIIDDDCRLSEISVPIIFEGQLIGVIDSEHPECNFYRQEHLELLETVAAISAVKIINAKSSEKLKNYQKDLELEVKDKTVELQNMIDKLRKSNLDLEHFAYAASHDLQEPIRTIASYLQLIDNREKNISSESREFLDFAIDGAKRMRKLLEGLLEYSKLGSSREDFEELRLEDILTLVSANLNTQLTEKRADVQFDELGFIVANKTQIFQLFQNIISNCVKFSKEDEEPFVQISVENTEKYKVIFIQDNGIGVDPAFHEKIFKLFSRLNTIDKFSGSGIGLALCKRIVENHDGEISIESEIGKGTRFIIKLPQNDNRSTTILPK